MKDKEERQRRKAKLCMLDLERKIMEENQRDKERNTKNIKLRNKEFDQGKGEKERHSVVVYFERRLGAAHSKCWSKQAF